MEWRIWHVKQKAGTDGLMKYTVVGTGWDGTEEHMFATPQGATAFKAICEKLYDSPIGYALTGHPVFDPLSVTGGISPIDGMKFFVTVNGRTLVEVDNDGSLKSLQWLVLARFVAAQFARSFVDTAKNLFATFWYGEREAT